MAQQAGARQHVFGYRNVAILKDQTLGHGSYGAVYKARCDQLTCAAKVLHPTIVDPYDPGAGRILQRFQQECEFLNRICHPHIVQYLGVCTDPESNLPVLLMELLDDSLTKMLEHSQNPISYHIQVDLCHDIALAVAYLHSNGIVHRDLSGNNVLVIAGRRAKVTDFGMSRLAGSDRHLTPLTFCPGTLGYMSPEALKEPPRYTEKLDVFSEGVIMIQVCTRQFPDPGPAVKEVEDPRSPVGTTQMPVLELERRKKHIDMIDPTHPLLPIATQCLEYRDRDRPTAEELCQRLASLLENPEYTESRHHTTPAEALRQERDELAREIEVKTREIAAREEHLATKDGELESKDQQLVAKDREIESKSQQLASKDQEVVLKIQQLATRHQENERLQIELQELNQRLVDNEQVTAEFQETNQRLRRQISDLQMQIEDLQRRLKETQKEVLSAAVDKELRWRDGGKAPFSDTREPTVVNINGNVAFFSSDKKVYSYDPSTGRWSTLLNCPQKWGSLATIRGLITMVGGVQTSDGKATSRLVSFTKREWVEWIPPMPTSRIFTTTTTHRNNRIVAGGSSSGYCNEDNMDTVEVLNTDNLVWSTAASLPHPLGHASATVCGDHLYLLGGNDSEDKCQTVFSCSLPELLQTCQTLCQTRSLWDRFKKLGQQQPQVWQRVTDTPMYYSTCTTVHGQLVAVGGCDENDRETTAVYKYDPTIQSWRVISHMATARSLSYVAVVNTNQLLVVGGVVRTSGFLASNGYSNSITLADF